jgi:hypothetical protein
MCPREVVAHDFDVRDAGHALGERWILCKSGVGADEQPRVGESETLARFEQIGRLVLTRRLYY